MAPRGFEKNTRIGMVHTCRGPCPASVSPVAALHWRYSKTCFGQSHPERTRGTYTPYCLLACSPESPANKFVLANYVKMGFLMIHRND